ncbi:MAG: rod shape-determining protein MreC [Candidatus Levybacteria bacterium]|nr:rod shape-determining protein MreC [Candidatus Levybacteria bacterium]
MQKRPYLFFTFVFFIFFCFFLILLSPLPFFRPVSNALTFISTPIQKILVTIVQAPSSLWVSQELNSLRDENRKLTKQLVDQKELIRQNNALSDQFQTVNPLSRSLVPANIVGVPSFIPGLSLPDTLTIDKGLKDFIKEGDIVVYKDILVGKIARVSQRLSAVELITKENVSITAKAVETNALGVIRGQGDDELVLDNVILSDTLKENDIVVTKGDMDIGGSGYPPNLVLGKIVSVDKKASALFQNAKVKYPLRVATLQTVFIIRNK